MKCILIFFALAAAIIPSSVFAQTEIVFRSVDSGNWTDPHNWEKEELGAWLKPINGSYPGDRYNRDVNVTISDGSTITVRKDEVIQVNSLCIMNGRVLVEGTLIVGPSKNDNEESGVLPANLASHANSIPAITDRPQLSQNMPNPLAPQFGYQTTITFYLDKQYSSASLGIYDQLGHLIQKIYNEENPSEGWHTYTVKLDGIISGSYPLILELPGIILQRMITILR